MVYKFDTQPMVSVNQLKTVPTPSSVIDRINSIGETRDQSNRIKFSIIDDREAFWDLELNQNNDNDSNIFDYSAHSGV